MGWTPERELGLMNEIQSRQSREHRQSSSFRSDRQLAVTDSMRRRPCPEKPKSLLCLGVLEMSAGKDVVIVRQSLVLALLRCWLNVYEGSGIS